MEMAIHHNDKSAINVDFDALFAGLNLQPGGDGYTTKEIMDATRMGTDAARSKIRRALEAGICTRSEKWVERIDGRMTRVTSYVFKGQGE
jgi:hypothetical protein